ncbi:MAG: intermembrane transport protein PqiB [Limisphaerales bacterium]
MPDKSPTPVPESKVVPKKRTRLSFVWVIPIVAAAAGVWVAVTKIMNEGPKITIVFQSAEGLEANKTKIQYSGLEIGTLTAIRLAEDRHHVIATAKMAPRTDEYLVKDTKFWVVRPQITGLNITGLGTLISGDYIGVSLGQSKESERNFTALDTAPLVSSDTPGRFFMLKTTELGSLSEGAPIYFRHLPAGQIISYELDKNGEGLNVKVFVQAPYDQYVTPNTRFWHASGVDMSLSATGLRVQTESLMSILAGGIAFETPATGPLLPPADADTVFTLFDDRSEAFRPPPRDPYTFRLAFRQSSVRGLTPGAPVEIGGVTIGQVTEVSPQFDLNTMEFSVPVTISVDPQRYGVKFLNVPGNEDTTARHRKVMDILVAHGLRANLKTGNLLTGSLYVSVDFFPDAPPASVDWAQNPALLPTMPGKTEEIEMSVADLLKNLNQTLTNTDKLLGSANKLIEPNSVLDTELNNMLNEGGGAARSLRVLADYLERHPEALIRGKTGEAK